MAKTIDSNNESYLMKIIWLMTARVGFCCIDSLFSFKYLWNMCNKAVLFRVLSELS